MSERKENSNFLFFRSTADNPSMRMAKIAIFLISTTVLFVAKAVLTSEPVIALSSPINLRISATVATTFSLCGFEG